MDPSENTIISFESPYGLRELCLAGQDPLESPGQTVTEQKFKLRMVKSENRRMAASVLVKKMYSWRGYTHDGPIDDEPSKIVLVADTAGETVGTMTLCFDDGDKLPADEIFFDKLDQLRAMGRSLCEPSRLAISNDVPKRVFASMIHISYIYTHLLHGVSDWVIEVNPRHVTFYKKMLGFQDFGEERICTRVNAPAVLLRLEMAYMAEKIRQFGGLMEQRGTEKSFYPYFFSSLDEPGIADRLAHGRL